MVEVRKLRRGDERLWISAVGSILAESDRTDSAASATAVASALDDPRCLLFVALTGETPIGLLSAYTFLDVVRGGRLAYLYDIQVLESRRRTGVGTALVKHLLASCSAAGVKKVWAGTDVSNVAARSTFEHTGAEVEGDSYVEYEWQVG